MRNTNLTLSVIQTIALLGILGIAMYFVFVVKPKETAQQQYLSIMQACNQQRLYMSWELKDSLKNVSEFAPQEEKDLINQTMENATEYFHSPEFYTECLEKTKQEWSL